MKGMPLFLRAAGRDIQTGTTYDSLNDLVCSKDYPEDLFEVWTDKGNLYVQIKAASKSPELRTPNFRKLYY